VTEEEVIETLRSASAAVNSAAVPDDLRAAAFKAAVRLLAWDAVSGDRNAEASARQPPAVGPQRATGSADSGSALLERIGERVHVTADRLGYVYAEDGRHVRVIIRSAKLAKAKAAGAQQVALLVMAGRQAAGIDDYTESSVLRDECKRYGKFDQTNFGKHMRALDDAVITQGKAQTTKRKLTDPGFDRAGELTTKLLGEEAT
jgi:hypothetical protein